MELAEALQLLHGQVVARQVQQRIEEQRAMAVGEDEAVTVWPLRVGGVVPQVMVPQHLGDLGHAHGHSRVSRAGALHRVHGEGADRRRELGEDGRFEVVEGGHRQFP